MVNVTFMVSVILMTTVNSQRLGSIRDGHLPSYMVMIGYRELRKPIRARKNGYRLRMLW